MPSSLLIISKGKQPIVEMLPVCEQHQISKAAAMLCTHLLRGPGVEPEAGCQGFFVRFTHPPDASHSEQSEIKTLFQEFVSMSQVF